MSIIDGNLDSLKYEIQDESRHGARIKVVGVGGCGLNAVSRLVEEGLIGPEFYAIDTDAQALAACSAPNKIQIGAKLTCALGAGSDPKIGHRAAEEDTNRLIEMLQGADMVFVAAGLGGGTGAGAASVVASLAKELDALTVAVVTKPFKFEGAKRMRLAEQSMEDLAEVVDTLITIPNDRILAIVPRGTSIKQAFRVADDILRQAVQGITDIICTPGMINLDFSDIKATMVGMGHAIMGTATARGENAAVEAARQAICSPLLEDTKIKGSKRMLINITCAGDLGLHEVDEACSIVREAADSDDLQITFGIATDNSLGDAVKVTVIATGFHMETPMLDAMREAKPFMDQIPDPIPVAATPVAPPPFAPPPFVPSSFVAAPEPPPIEEPEPVVETPIVPMLNDLDDLDTPAYLRQGKHLN
jgi:cell division protein FtsZ